MSEHQLYELIATYLRLQYPNVIYRFDLAADLKLTAGQAAKHKRLHPRRGYPDLFIAHPMGKYHGMYLELKKDGTRLRKRNGDFASEHIQEQWQMLGALTLRGYKAEFAIGYDDAVRQIKAYLAQNKAV